MGNENHALGSSPCIQYCGPHSTLHAMQTWTWQPNNSNTAAPNPPANTQWEQASAYQWQQATILPWGQIDQPPCCQATQLQTGRLPFCVSGTDRSTPMLPGNTMTHHWQAISKPAQFTYCASLLPTHKCPETLVGRGVKCRPTALHYCTNTINL